MAGGEMLSFPRRPEREQAQALALNVRPDPPLETFDPPRARELLGVAQHVVSGGRAFIEFVDLERSISRQAGIETIGIEVSSILADDRIKRMVDALEESAKEGRSADISLEGLSEMRRLERLLAEASSSINSFTGGGHRLEAIRKQHEPGLGGMGDAGLPTSAGRSEPSETLLLASVIGFGVATVALVLVVVFSQKK